MSNSLEREASPLPCRSQSPPVATTFDFTTLWRASCCANQADGACRSSQSVVRTSEPHTLRRSAYRVFSSRSRKRHQVVSEWRCFRGAGVAGASVRRNPRPRCRNALAARATPARTCLHGHSIIPTAAAADTRSGLPTLQEWNAIDAVALSLMLWCKQGLPGSKALAWPLSTARSRGVSDRTAPHAAAHRCTQQRSRTMSRARAVFREAAHSNRVAA